MITYTSSLAGIGPHSLQGFFDGWPRSPSPEALLRILQGSREAILAIDTADERVVGYITAISDGVSCAYIPHLEVLRDFRGRGIGSELVRRMLDRLRNLYMIDLLCDAELQPFYARFGMQPASGMAVRNRDRQACD